jgi:serine-type D-Ala-D-Ala endopeptidase (penicillin-binding protein 7)
MVKSALGIFFSLLFAFGLLPSAHGKDGATSATKKAPSKHAGARVTRAKSATKTTRAKVAAKKSRRKHVASLDSRERIIKKTIIVRGKRKQIYQRVAYRPVVPAVPPVVTAGDLAGLHMTRDPLELKSNVALVVDQNTSEVLFEKNANVPLPMASITKLMTSLIVLEANQDMDEILEVTEEDIDREKFTHSRLRIGARLTRANMLHIALMSSENRAASALGRHYPGGIRGFVAAMNAKARELGMTNTRYVDSTGLSSNNVASARDLAKLVAAAHQYAMIRYYSTDSKYAVEPGGSVLQYRNSNHLVDNPEWEIGLQKTGYISEAGRCLVMQASIDGRPVVMVFLDSKGKLSRLADASRVRKWLSNRPPVMSSAAQSPQG